MLDEQKFAACHAWLCKLIREDLNVLIDRHVLGLAVNYANRHPEHDIRISTGDFSARLVLEKDAATLTHDNKTYTYNYPNSEDSEPVM